MLNYASTIHQFLTVAVIILAIPTLLSLLKIDAPYGKYNRHGFGPQIGNRAAWIIMEIPSVLFFLFIYVLGAKAFSTVPLIFLTIWQAHYIHRTFIFPFKTKTSSKKMPLSIALTGALYNVINSFINAFWISELGNYSTEWLTTIPFLVGIGLFGAGFYLNLRSDYSLLQLRKPGETSYHIPYGGAFTWVSCPNYLGEILEWAGWAVMTYSLAGLSFFVFTFANLFPRALANHKWYKKTFPNYPRQRKALIPFII